MDFTVYDYKRVTSMVIHSMVWIDTSYESFMQKNANTHVYSCKKTDMITE